MLSACSLPKALTCGVVDFIWTGVPTLTEGRGWCLLQKSPCSNLGAVNVRKEKPHRDSLISRAATGL
jgi:hypothetical protein